MTTFDTQQPYLGEYPDQPPRTSGMAVTALVLSILGIIPCCGAVTAGIGAIMGLVGVVTIGSDPSVKGRGMSAAAVIIGVLLLVIQITLGVWVFNAFYGPMRDGPTPALVAGYAGDYAGFRDAFYGPGTAATDDEIEAFIAELRSRYGDFVSAELVGDAAAGPGQPAFVGRYRLQFTNATVEADTEIIVADETTGQVFIMKIGYIRIIDRDHDDLEYPPPGQP